MDSMLGFKQFIVEMANPWPSGKEGEKQIISALAGEKAHPRAEIISNEIKKKYGITNDSSIVDLAKKNPQTTRIVKTGMGIGSKSRPTEDAIVSYGEYGGAKLAYRSRHLQVDIKTGKNTSIGSLPRQTLTQYERSTQSPNIPKKTKEYGEAGQSERKKVAQTLTGHFNGLGHEEQINYVKHVLNVSSPLEKGVKHVQVIDNGNVTEFHHPHEVWDHFMNNVYKPGETTFTAERNGQSKSVYANNGDKRTHLYTVGVKPAGGGERGNVLNFNVKGYLHKNLKPYGYTPAHTIKHQ